MTMILPQIGAWGGASGASITLNESNRLFYSNSTTYTISINAGSGGFIALAFFGRADFGASSIELISVTIDGKPASVIFSPCIRSLGSYMGVAYVGGVSSGTVTAVVTLSNQSIQILWATYTITGLASEIPHGTANLAGGPSNTASVSLDIPEGGVQLASVCWEYSEAGNNIDWINATEDWAAGNQNMQLSTASDAGLSAETGRTITVNATSSNPSEIDFYHLIAASWA